MQNNPVEELLLACEDISRQVVMKSHAMATTLGLSPSDFEHLSLLVKTGPMTAGGLATTTALTTGAITGIIDRLEEAGLANRQYDPSDRRRIIVVPTEKAVSAIQAFHDKFQRDFTRCVSNYSSTEQTAILNFLRTTADFLREQTARIGE